VKPAIYREIPLPPTSSNSTSLEALIRKTPFHPQERLVQGRLHPETGLGGGHEEPRFGLVVVPHRDLVDLEEVPPLEPVHVVGTIEADRAQDAELGLAIFGQDEETAMFGSILRVNVLQEERVARGFERIRVEDKDDSRLGFRSI
jgi:hypothetical protein